LENSENFFIENGNSAGRKTTEVKDSFFGDGKQVRASIWPRATFFYLKFLYHKILAYKVQAFLCGCGAIEGISLHYTLLA
jgi:hypothetical protein